MENLKIRLEALEKSFLILIKNLDGKEFGLTNTEVEKVLLPIRSIADKLSGNVREVLDHK